MAHTNPIKPLGYRPREASRISGLGLTKTHELIGNGTLKSVKVGRARIVLAESLHDLLENGAPD